MTRTLQAFVMVFALALSPIALADMLAQAFSYTGGTVKGIKVKTDASLAENHSKASPSDSPGPFERLVSSDLTVHVNAGDSDLFVYQIDAQCDVDGGDEDYVDLQARVNGFVRGVIGGPAFLQPQSVPTFLVMCPGPRPFLRSVAKRWVTRLLGGSEGFDYTFTIWWRVVDQFPRNLGFVNASLSKRIVTLTRYD